MRGWIMQLFLPCLIFLSVVQQLLHVSLTSSYVLCLILPNRSLSTNQPTNSNGLVEEFADLLKLQLDLREEAINLDRFNQNFKDDPVIVFPKLISEFPCSKNVLVETFVEGIPVLQFAKDNQEDQQMLHDMCVAAIRAVCKMIFLDNFMHGTLHG